MKKRVLGILLALVMVVSLVPERVMAGTEPVHYITWNGDGTPEDNECSSYTTVGTERMSA